MRVVYRTNGLTEDENRLLEQCVEKKAKKLSRVCGRIQGQAALLRVNARKTAKPQQFRVAMTLSLRRGVLFAERHNNDVLSTIDRVVDALIEEVRAFRTSLYQARQRRRSQRLSEELILAEPYLAEKAKLSDREAFEERLRPLLGPLHGLAIGELENRLIAGELAPGAVDPEDVVDEVVARVYEAFRDGTIEPPLKTWLVSAMTRYLDEVERQERTDPALCAEVHLEERVAEYDPMDVRSMGDQKLEFYTLDEALHVEDVFPDLALRSPEEQVSAREQMRIIHRIIKKLPRVQRQSFLLHADGYDDMEISMVQKRSETDIRRDIEAVRELILNQLRAEA